MEFEKEQIFSTYAFLQLFKSNEKLKLFRAFSVYLAMIMIQHNSHHKDTSQTFI